MASETVNLKSGHQVPRIFVEAVMHQLRLMDADLLYALAMKARLPSFQIREAHHDELCRLGYLDGEFNGFGSWVDRGIKQGIRDIVLSATELIDGTRKVKLWPPAAEEQEHARREETLQAERARQEEIARGERTRQEELARAERARQKRQRWKRWLQHLSPSELAALLKRLGWMSDEVWSLDSQSSRAAVSALFEDAPPVLVQVRFPEPEAVPAWHLCEAEDQLNDLLKQLGPGVELRLSSVWDLTNVKGEVCLRK